MSSKEQDIVNAIRTHDRSVFETLYKEHYRQLFALAFRYVRQAPAAEEIVHDVFLMIWKKADQLTIEYSIKSYLYKSVVNASLNFIKKEKTERGKQEIYLKVNVAETNENDEREQQEALLANLENAIDILPPKCREVMYLSRFGKLKQQEIADQMQISVKTVKNHLTYGFQKIREHLGNRPRQLWIAAFILLKYLGY
ncbi:RNA polymerase sigma-70 factor, ECF subfamily [Pedobacter westerhofensis]|uniref:RNA polymerase sigma-70 factor, ECF subfamily n=1 Tax=Pedobacter westerhofensis TaxID=425512 RepID=A0A521FR53_9SPHI|nr:RNA polymerase sigma-70 factor [Pedobacter westerhofensis]SMO97941.1 RNA polymerase sigma-70 factor, ECF subfamily [Pedobacter westerhofensis]